MILFGTINYIKKADFSGVWEIGMESIEKKSLGKNLVGFYDDGFGNFVVGGLAVSVPEILKKSPKQQCRRSSITRSSFQTSHKCKCLPIELNHFDFH